MNELNANNVPPDNIVGVQFHPLKRICDERGAVLHMLRSDSPCFKGFGEVYFSLTYPGFVKGWKLHRRISQLMCVPSGDMRFVLFDPREGSRSFNRVQSFVIGESNYTLLELPANIWYGFSPVGTSPALIANCTSEPHDPTESERLELNSERIPYQWSAV
jgi:dTDP-4-dehydrorhamnose 3,5-epimerase